MRKSSAPHLWQPPPSFCFVMVVEAPPLRVLGLRFQPQQGWSQLRDTDLLRWAHLSSRTGVIMDMVFVLQLVQRVHGGIKSCDVRLLWLQLILETMKLEAYRRFLMQMILNMAAASSKADTWLKMLLIRAFVFMFYWTLSASHVFLINTEWLTWFC